MSDQWDADQYLRFQEERTQPAIDLLCRVAMNHPHTIVDLGCGTGNSTALLKEKWPAASVTGIDYSENMLKKARENNLDIIWEYADILQWQPPQPIDLIFANASLQWLHKHEILFPKLFSYLNSNGVFAAQMPNNFNEPSHHGLLEVITKLSYQQKLLSQLQYSAGQNPVGTPEFYYNLFAPLAKEITIWQTKYLSILSGDNPVLEWMKGSTLRPLLQVLNQTEREEFLNKYSEKLLQSYPKQKDGKTLFMFKRIFIVVKKT